MEVADDKKELFGARRERPTCVVLDFQRKWAGSTETTPFEDTLAQLEHLDFELRSLQIAVAAALKALAAAAPDAKLKGDVQLIAEQIALAFGNQLRLLGLLVDPVPHPDNESVA